MKNYTINEEDVLQLFQAIEITKQGLAWSTNLNALQATTALQQFKEVKDNLSKQMLDYSVAKAPAIKLPPMSPVTTIPAKKKPIVKRTKKVN